MCTYANVSKIILNLGGTLSPGRCKQEKGSEATDGVETCVVEIIIGPSLL